MRRSSEIADLNVSVIRTIQDIVDRGLRTGVFKRRADAIDVHMLISAFCFFRVSNRYTFGTIFPARLVGPRHLRPPQDDDHRCGAQLPAVE